MKQIKGYLLDKATGAGISGKAVAFTKLDGSLVTTADTYAQQTSASTAGDGSFYGNFELSPGPVNVTVTAGASEVKKRMNDERAEFGYQWASDISRIARGTQGVISGFLNELAVSTPSGHTIRIATGGAIFNGSVFSIEMNPMDIAGVANTNPGLNPRIDLVTLRQYNESAAGQLSGKQQVIVTLGTTSNTPPSVPTGGDFVDFPLAEVSTAYNASGKTVNLDRRVYNPASISPTDPRYEPLFFDQDIGPSGNKVNAAYFTAATLNMTGLDKSLVYDGYIDINLQINSTSLGAFYEVIWRQSQSHQPWLRPTSLSDRRIARFAGQDNTQIHQLNYRIPIIGLTGVTSASYPLQLQCYAVSGNLTYLQSSLDSGNALTNRMHAVLYPRK